uniref:Zinc finger protein 106a n=1 Tax=Gadus morhua TaxID=8049 RepID=A0A8C4ZG00_GADMO
MGRERKCILCEMVCSSKQEMDDHMRTMLHHRELEKLKGRDCGHDCTVCRVTLVSLTDYAGHISSPQHKQNVEASESAAGAGSQDRDMDYFDQALDAATLGGYPDAAVPCQHETAGGGGVGGGGGGGGVGVGGGPCQHKTAGSGGVFAKPAPVERDARPRQSDADAPGRKKKPTTSKKNRNRNRSSSGSRSSSSNAAHLDDHSSGSGRNSAGVKGDTPRDAKGDTTKDTQADTRGDKQRETKRDTKRDTPMDTQRATPEVTQRDAQRDTQRDAQRDTQRDTQRDVSRSHQGTGSEESETAPNGSSPPPPPAAPAAPGLTRLGLTGPLLTKHAGSKGKPGSHEPSLHKPNLNIARRVRNVSESRRGDAEKESGLKPTVRQLISSSGSRRNVNWEQVYQEVRKKQGQGKGWPRFGIEMVSYDREEPPHEEDPDMALLEGFQWDSLLDSAHAVAPRKRSLSESSLAPGRPAPSLDLFSCHVPGDRPDGGGEEEDEEEEEEQQGGPPPQTRPPAPEEQEEAEHKVFPSQGAEPASGADGGPAAGRAPEVGARRPSEGVKKGRGRVLQRAESEVEVGGLGAELLDAQAMGKKRRAAGVKRFLVDQLLTVSQKEEELSLSLQALDNGLLQARATLQAAYMDVQRIMVQKQQVANISQPPAYHHPLSSPPDPVKLQWSPDRGPVADQTHTPPPMGHGSPAHCQDDLPAAGGPMLDRAVQVDRESSPLDSKLHLAPRRTSDPGNHGNASVKSEESGPTPALHLPLPPPALPLSTEMWGKRVRKLRKRRVLNKTQGAEPAGATSDTEADEDAAAAKPRRLPPRRRSSAGSTVSTSTPPTAPEDGEPLEEEEERERERVTPTREEEFDSALEMGESCADVVNLESSELEECMEVTMACQQPQVPGPGLGLGLGLGLGPAPDSSRAEFFNLAYVSSDPGEEEAPTEGVFEGHQEAVNGLQIHKGLLYTCSGDRTVKAFDLVSHECVAVFEGHSSKVNCVLVSATVGLTHRLYSGSSDQTVRCYSLRTGVLEQQFSLSDRVLCLHSRWKVLYAGLANGTVATFNLKTNRPMEVFECHGPRAVSCLSSAQEGARKVLLVGSYDSTVSVRDARNGLLLRTLGGHTKTVLCMKVVNDLVFSGSSDQSVHAHNIHTGELVRIYRGHSHAVTMVAILGKVMLTASLDKLVRVYELQSHDRLQVYGGHKDMVMCMTVYKSMIYTGCYDGSVQAVKLNLLQNFRCMWHGCSLVFGVREHLEQHLADAHANHCFQTLKCRWRSCDEFFCSRNGSKQGIAAHMQKHVEDLVKSDT